MNEILKLIRTSKTAKSGVLTIVWGILILFGITEGAPPPQTIDGLGKPPQSNNKETVVGVGALLSGLMTLKGRNDAEHKIKRLENDEAK